MASSNRKTSDVSSYDVWERAFSDKSDISPKPLLRGIHNYETALKAHRKAHEYDARERFKRFIAQKLEHYKD